MKAVPVTDRNKEAYLSQIPEHVQKEASLMLGVQTDEDVACGVMALEAKDEFLFINYVYVAEKYRSRGALKAMIDLAEKIGVANGFLMMASSYSLSSDLEIYDNSLLKLGFSTLESGSEGKLFKVPFGVLITNIPEKKIVEEVMYFSDMTTRRFEKLRIYMEQLLSGESVETVPILREKTYYDGNLSVAVFDADEKLKGCILSTVNSDKEITIEYVFSKGNHPKSLISMFQAIANKAKRIFSEDTPVYIQADNLVSESLVHKLGGEQAVEVAKVITRYKMIG